MMLGNVGGMVVDVMTTQGKCCIWLMLKPMIFGAITTSQQLCYV